MTYTGESTARAQAHRGAYGTYASVSSATVAKSLDPESRCVYARKRGRQRPLGIAALEDKIVQYAVGTVLNQIWEEDFLGFSYGFRPRRSQQDALDALWVGVVRKKVNWIIDLDVQSFFDKLQHDWLVQFVEHRIGDQRVVRLIQKWLKAGVMEEGQWHETKEGSPQGAVISPILANLYLHHVLDLWVESWRKKQARGEVIPVRAATGIVRYADDAVLGFEHREEAERFLEHLRERLRKFGLELHPEKTTFTAVSIYSYFHRCPCATAQGNTQAWQPSSKIRHVRKRIRAKLRPADACGACNHREVARASGAGYFQYHAIPGNWARLAAFRKEVLRMWYQTLRRRSQRSRSPGSAFARAWAPCFH
ncbi:MAG: reverse transcriptase domain-containing protein [Bryobacteraceae bacterium]